MLISRFLVKKRVIYQISDTRDREKTDKIESMTKKRSSEMLGRKTGFFPKKVIKKLASPKLGATSPPMLCMYAGYNNYIGLGLLYTPLA